MVCLTSAPMQVYPARRGLSLAWLLYSVYEVVRAGNLEGQPMQVMARGQITFNTSGYRLIHRELPQSVCVTDCYSPNVLDLQIYRQICIRKSGIDSWVSVRRDMKSKSCSQLQPFECSTSFSSAQFINSMNQLFYNIFVAINVEVNLKFHYYYSARSKRAVHVVHVTLSDYLLVLTNSLFRFKNVSHLQAERKFTEVKRYQNPYLDGKLLICRKKVF